MTKIRDLTHLLVLSLPYKQLTKRVRSSRVLLVRVERLLDESRATKELSPPLLLGLILVFAGVDSLEAQE